MSLMIPLWYGLCLGLAFAYFGFWFGRSRNWGLLEASAQTKDERQEKHQENYQEPSLENYQDKGAPRRGTHRDAPRRVGPPRQVLPHVRYLSSPAGGVVEGFSEAGRTGARILTTESKLYSPSSGRVLSISPRGNAFLIMTDWGDEVEVRACNSEDDLLDRYFRPRVVRGEIIRRGKLLLEYDREKLNRECEDTAVYLTAMEKQDGNMELTEEAQVQIGEALFWVNPSSMD